VLRRASITLLIELLLPVYMLFWNKRLVMAILSVLACGFYTSPAHGKLVGDPVGPQSQKVCRPLPYNINIIYTSLKSTFSGLQFCCRHYVSICIRLAVVVFQNCEITRNSNKIWPYISSRSSKVIDLGVNRKLRCDFLLVINSNFGRISYCFRYIVFKARK